MLGNGNVDGAIVTMLSASSAVIVANAAAAVGNSVVADGRVCVYMLLCLLLTAVSFDAVIVTVVVVNFALANGRAGV